MTEGALRKQPGTYQIFPAVLGMISSKAAKAHLKMVQLARNFCHRAQPHTRLEVTYWGVVGNKGIQPYTTSE